MYLCDSKSPRVLPSPFRLHSESFLLNTDDISTKMIQRRTVICLQKAVDIVPIFLIFFQS